MPRFAALAALLALTSLAAGCSGDDSSNSSGSTGSTGGTLQGALAFEPNTTLGWRTDEGAAHAVTFDISGDAVTCESRQKPDGGFEASRGLFDVLASGTVQVPDGGAVQPGHYPDDAGAEVSFLVQVREGNDIHIILTNTGSIDVDAIAPNFKGSFTTRLGLEDGGESELSGTFDAPYCN